MLKDSENKNRQKLSSIISGLSRPKGYFNFPEVNEKKAEAKLQTTKELVEST